MKDYCDNETSRELKELGFPTKVTFIGEQATIEIPINSGWIHLYEAQKWLREEKNMIVDVRYGAQYYNVVLNHRICGRHIVMDKNNRIADFTEYDKALSEGIKEAVKILKKK